MNPFPSLSLTRNIVEFSTQSRGFYREGFYSFV